MFPSLFIQVKSHTVFRWSCSSVVLQPATLLALLLPSTVRLTYRTTTSTWKTRLIRTILKVSILISGCLSGEIQKTQHSKKRFSFKSLWWCEIQMFLTKSCEARVFLERQQHKFDQSLSHHCVIITCDNELFGTGNYVLVFCLHIIGLK